MTIPRDADGWPVEWQEAVRGARLAAIGSGRRQKVYSFHGLSGRRVWTYVPARAAQQLAAAAAWHRQWLRPLLLGSAPDGLPWDAPVDENGKRYSRWSDVRNPLPGEQPHTCT